MNHKSLRSLCLSLPEVSEEVKWRQDRCFAVAGKVFCITDSDADGGASFKVLESEFEDMISREGIIPAPYLDREFWVLALEFSWLNDTEWEHYVRQSYALVKAQIP